MIHAKYDFAAQSWEVSGEFIHPSTIVAVSLSNHESHLSLCSFGFSVTGDSDAIFSYPPEGVKYVHQEDQPSVAEEVASEVYEEVSLSFWAESNGFRSEHIFSSKTIRPIAPNPDCVWNEESKTWEWPEHSAIEAP